ANHVGSLSPLVLGAADRATDGSLALDATMGMPAEAYGDEPADALADDDLTLPELLAPEIGDPADGALLDLDGGDPEAVLETLEPIEDGGLEVEDTNGLPAALLGGRNGVSLLVEPTAIDLA